MKVKEILIACDMGENGSLNLSFIKQSQTICWRESLEEIVKYTYYINAICCCTSTIQ